MLKIEEKIRLRKPEISDVESLYVLKNDVKSSETLGGFSSGYTKTSIADWINFHNNASDEVIFIIQDFKSEKIIGHVGLYNIDYRVRKAEFAILIADMNYRGKGYGTLCTEFMIKYGFEQLNLNRIELSLFTDNLSALAVYKKTGFIQEGIQRQAQFKNGRYHDLILMAIFRDE
jgi:[ribosomal protein S5]-alanine N-acetyltransferase